MKLSGLFSDHMVLQCDKPVSVWGEGAPGDAITVSFAGQNARAQVAPNGRWKTSLAPMPASASPREMQFRSEKTGEQITLSDVLVGEVWLASGQSNMWWQVSESNDAENEITAAHHPLLRLFTVPQAANDAPVDVLHSTWQTCSPETVPSFSAVAYYFGRTVQRDLGVPVGLVHSSWGGTRIEAWTSRDSLITDPAGQKVVESYESRPDDPTLRAQSKAYHADRVAWERSLVIADPGNEKFAQGWADPAHDDAAWETMRLPSKWQSQGHPYSGVFWFRREIDVPADWAGRDLELRPGACDKHDTTYFNGVHVGSTGWETTNAWCQRRNYRVPGHLVRAGRNVIAIRVYSYMTDGGLIGPFDAMRVAPAEPSASDQPIALKGDWRYRIEHNFGPQPTPVQPLGPGNPNTPCILFNNMIRPLMPLTLRGAIWYQGESNASAAAAYRTLFPLMIDDWRRAFEQPTLEFYFVQLANYTAAQTQPVEAGWADLRDAQTATLSVPHTGMAVAIDIGDANDIHPRNKQDVGRRLAVNALANVYGKPIVPSGPLYRSHVVEGDAIRVHFDHAQGLTTRDDAPPAGFAIAGADGIFEWADARIEHDTIIARSARVPHPTQLRYAWANNPRTNLYNAAGLPASPFKTP